MTQARLDITPGRDPRKIAEDLKRLGEGAKEPYVGQWAENLAHASGLLRDATKYAISALAGGWITVQTSTAATANRYGAPSPVDILRPILSRYLGRHLALMGGYQVIGRTGTQEDKDQGEAAEKVLEDKWDNADLDIACMEAFGLAQSCSHGYVLIEGDDTLNPPTSYEIDGEIREQRSGDVVYRALSPFQIYVLPGIRSLSESPLLIRDFMTVAEYERRWGPLPPDCDPKSARYDAGQLDTLVADMEKGMIEVQRLFLPQSIERPKGEQWIIVGEAPAKAVQDEQGNNWMGVYNSGTEKSPKYAYPVVDFRDEPLHMGYWGFGRQSAARPIVKVLCSVWSRLAQICSLPLMLAKPDGSDFGDDEIANVPYQVIEYNPSVGPPSFLTPGVCEYLHKMLDRCMFWLGEIYSQHESSRGMPSGSRFPAEAVKLLQEQDLLADSPAGKMALKAMQQVGQKSLGEGLRVWDEEYTVVVLGKENTYKRWVLKKKALQPGVDVRIIPGNERPKSKSALVKELTEAGRWDIIPKKEIRRLMGAPTKEDMYDADAFQIQNIKMEETAFEQGQNPPVHWADDNELHVQMHERAAVERRQVASPEEDNARKQHNMLHLEELRVKAEQEAAAQLEAAQQGMAPPGPGKEPQAV